MKLIQKYTKKGLTFKKSSDNRYIRVYDKYARFKGFIFNNDRSIYVDGDLVKASEFFK